jgi:hypothetical protein
MRTRNTIDIICACIAVLIGMLAFAVFAADEISLTTFLKVNNGEFQLERRISNQKIDQANNSMSYNIQSIGTSTHEQISIIVDVVTNGISYFRNITTNTDRTVDIGRQGTSGVFYAFARLKATEVAVLRLHPTNTIFAKANGGAVQIEAWIIED